MSKVFDIVPRWVPAILMMIIIFGFSSRPDGTLPDFHDADRLVKKTAHVIVFGALALSYLHALPKPNYGLAWLLTIIYAASDEFHQSFVPGRTSLMTDVFVFDNIGAILALFLHYRFFGANYEKEIH